MKNFLLIIILLVSGMRFSQAQDSIPAATEPEPEVTQNRLQKQLLKAAFAWIILP